MLMVEKESDEQRGFSLFGDLLRGALFALCLRTHWTQLNITWTQWTQVDISEDTLDTTRFFKDTKVSTVFY